MNPIPIDINYFLVFGSTILSAGFSVGGFWALVSYRLKRLEEERRENKDLRERLIRIEAMMNHINSKFE